MFRRSYFSFSLIVIIGFAALTLWLDNVTKPLPQQTDANLYQQPDYIIENISGLRVEHNSAIQRKFYANTLFHYLNQDLTKLENIHFLHLKPDTPSFRVFADHAEIRNSGENIFLTDHVTVIRGQDVDKGKITLKTDKLHLIPDQERVTTDKRVVISKLNTTVSAIGMELSNQTGMIELLSRVHAVDR